ncbi:MAG: hypothetical protein KDJ15_04085 [Alphaproteobacteria bacterium]|nr:hypothetical protein [Alphaproteobacteria bacterium]
MAQELFVDALAGNENAVDFSRYFTIKKSGRKNLPPLWEQKNAIKNKALKALEI